MADQQHFDVFLSHNSADKPAVREIEARLRERGISAWLDVYNLLGGSPWMEEIEQALRACDTCAVFMGPSGLGPWQNQEMRAALNRAVRERDAYRVIPVLLPGAKPDQVPDFLSLHTWVDFRRGLDDAEALARLIASIKGEPYVGSAYALSEQDWIFPSYRELGAALVRDVDAVSPPELLTVRVAV